MKRYGFTLAETLVTLGIIGVVSAITLPILTKNYQKFVVKQQIKQTYNLISNAVNAVATDDELPHDCYYGIGIANKTKECRDFFEAVLTKLQVQKFCPNQGYQNGCVPDYSVEYFPNINGCAGFSSQNIKNSIPTALLKNGNILFIYSDNVYGSYPLVGFDINGFKGPNRPGIDVYAIQIRAKQQGRPVYGLGESVNMTQCFSTKTGAFFYNLYGIIKN